MATRSSKSDGLDRGSHPGSAPALKNLLPP